MSGVTVYWQPGCTSCLRTQEFLREHGVAFESVNVAGDPAAMARLRSLGARSVPVVARGGRWIHAQDLAAVADFVGTAPPRPQLEIPVLVARLLGLLDSSARLTEQLPADALETKLPGRDRTHLGLAYHVAQVVVGFLDAALGGRLTFEHFERLPPDHLRTAADAARLTRSVSQALAVWWGGNQSRLPAAVDTYDGVQPLHAVLERTTWHVARHARQLESLLELRGVTPSPRLAPVLLEGLPLPADGCDTEVPLT